MANEKIFTIKIDGVEKSYKQVVKLSDALNELKDVDVKINVGEIKPIDLKINGLEDSFNNASKLRDVLKEIKDTSTQVTIALKESTRATQESTNANKEKAKSLTDEEKAERKLEQARQRRLSLDTDIAREQIAMNQQVRERQNQLQRSIQLENAETGSIDEKRLQIGSLTGAYRALSEEERKSEHIGGAMLKQIQDLRKEYNELERSLGNHAVNVGNYESATEGLGKRFDELGESINQTAENTKGILNMFQAGAGALALFGNESETTQKMLSDLGKVLAVVSALQAANNILLSKGAIASKLASVMEGVHSIQIRARAISMSLATKETVLATIAQRVFNSVAKANPYLVLAAALITVIGAVAAYRMGTDEATESTKKYTSSLDGVSYATEEARDAHDQHLRRVRDLQIEYRVLIGDLTNYQAKLLQIANKTDDRISEINKKYSEQIKEIQEQYKVPFWETNPFTGEGTGIQYEARMKERNEKIRNLEQEKYNEIEEIRKEGDHEEIIAQEKQNKERIELQDKLASDLKTGLDKELFDLQIQRNKALDEAKEKGVESNKVYEVYAKKETDIRDKYIKQNAEKAKQASDKAKQNAEKQKEIIKSLQKFQDDTSKIEQQNVLNRINANRELIKSVKEVTGSYEDQKAILREQSDENIKTVSLEYDELIKKAKEAGVDVSKLTEVKNERVKALEVQLANELSSLEKERVEKVKEINEKAVQNRQQLIGLEMAQLDTFYNSIESRLDNLEVKNSGGIINVEATRKNIDEANKSLTEYLGYLQKSKKQIEQYYNEILTHYDKDSIEYKQLLLEKQNALQGFQKQEAGINKEITDNTKKETELQSDYWKQAGEKIQGYIDSVMNGVTAIFDGVNSILQAQLDEANEKYDAISQKYDEVVEKREESDSRIQELEERAKTARGGRSLILQQQITQEMEANKQLADQEKRLAKEKEKQEKEIAKKERQMKKAQLASDIASGLAGTALAIINAMQVKPFPLGVVLASVAGAMGAVQVGVMTKQLSKLEDGGLLNGKRHSQGGMRVEGTNIEVEGGEYVINRESTNKNLGLIRYINNQRRELTPTDINSFFSKSSQGFEPPFKRMFEAGGQLPTITDSVNTDNEIIADAIRSMKIEPRVAVTDINDAQTDIVKVDNWTGL